MNNLLKDRNALPGKAGSFWTATLDRDQQPLVRGLTDLTENSLTQAVTAVSDRLTAKSDGAFTFRTLKVDPRKIVQFSPDMQQRILVRFSGGYVIRPAAVIAPETINDHGFLVVSGDSGLLSTEGGELIAFPLPGFSSDIPGSFQAGTVLRPRWLVSIPDDIEPVRIHSLKGDLVCGVDFVVSPGLLHFFEDPTSLFLLPHVPVACAVYRQTSLFGYTLKLDATQANLFPVANYFRGAQTAKTFETAVACASGLVVLPQESRLDLVLPLPLGYRYVFKDYVIEARYAHTALTLDEVYPKNHVVGGCVRVTSGGLDRPYWYRELDWSAGLPLDSISPFKGLVAADGQRSAYTTTQISGSKYHVRIELDGDDATQDLFWSRVAAAELNSGRYLCDILNMTGEGFKQVNPVDVFFESGLAGNAIVVDLINMPDAEFLSRALTFIENEKPVGASVITRILS